MAKARPIPGLSEDLPYGMAAARVLSVRAQEVAEHAPGVLDTADIERVHDMRIATRRLRAALEVFEPCFPSKRAKAVLTEVKAIADALGERRDRDVHIAAMEHFATALSAPDRPGIDSLIGTLSAEQAEANEALVPYVRDERLGALGERLRELVRDAETAAR
jgi:CHAD domain-containing protein